MAIDTFDYSVSAGASGTAPVTTYSAQFGDGYKQVSADGMNAAMETWSLTCNGRPDDMVAVRDFLVSHCASSFYWKNPWGETKLYRVKADSIAPTFSYSNYVGLSFTFEQTVSP